MFETAFSNWTSSFFLSYFFHTQFIQYQPLSYIMLSMNYLTWELFVHILCLFIYGTNYSRMDQVKFVEDSF